MLQQQQIEFSGFQGFCCRSARPAPVPFDHEHAAKVALKSNWASSIDS